ncbi:MAG: thioredoxin family protein [Planctomycetales bacterium]|nr:thioredoxin family protein [Planctomycetales bacterium]
MPIPPRKRLRRTCGSFALLCLAACPVAADVPHEATVDIKGTVVDSQSEGIAGVKVYALGYGVEQVTVSQDDGSFQLAIPQARINYFAVLADDVSGDRMGYWQVDWKNPPTGGTRLEVAISASRRIPVVVHDVSGQPAANSQVGAMLPIGSPPLVVTNRDGRAELRLPSEASVRSLFASKDDVGFDYRIVMTPRDEAYRAEWLNDPPVRFQLAEARSIEMQLLNDIQDPLSNTRIYLWLLQKPGEPDTFNLSVMNSDQRLFNAFTTDKGIVRFEGVPTWDTHPLWFWADSEDHERSRIEFDHATPANVVVTNQLMRLVPVTGRVTLPDGAPASGIPIKAIGVGYDRDSFHETVYTDDGGTYRVNAAPGRLYMLTVVHDRWSAPVIDGFVVRPGTPISGLNFRLQPTVRVHGRVTIGPDRDPVANQRMGLNQIGRNLRELEGVELHNPTKLNFSIQPMEFRSTNTNKQGEYEFYVGPGSFQIGGPSQVKSQAFEIAADDDITSLEFNFDSPRPEAGPITIAVVTGNPPVPVANAVVEGKYRAFVNQFPLRLRTGPGGSVAATRALHPTVVYAQSEDRTMAGIMEIDSEQPSATIAIGPVASAHGTIIDQTSGEPLANTKVFWGRRVYQGDDNSPYEVAWGGTEITDAEGAFALQGLVVGQAYDLSVPRGDGSYGSLTSITPERAERIDLGTLQLAPPYRPPTLEERMEKALATDVPLRERFEKAVQEAQRLRQHVLLVFVDRESPVSRRWFELQFNDRVVRNALPNYQLLLIDATGSGTQKFAEQLELTIATETLPSWQFRDAEGNPLHALEPLKLKTEAGEDSSAAAERSTATQLDAAHVAEMLARFAPEPLDARALWDQAFSEAKETNRRVLVQETATWCGPCHRLARFLEEHRSRWEKDYVWIRIDQRWEGADEVMNRLKEGYRGGIPWFAIVDADGTALANSDGPNGNIGFPTEPEEIDHLLTMFRSTRHRLRDEDLEAMRTSLERQ